MPSITTVAAAASAVPKRASGRQNTKRAWRKNEGAEDVTSEWLASKEAEPQGPAYAERSDAEIFVVDTAPLASAAEAEKKPNFLDQILANDSAVTAVGRRATENNLKQGILPVSAVRVEGAKHLASKAELHKIEQRVKRAKKMTEAEKKGIEKARIARLHAHKKEVKSAKAACPSYDLWGTPKTHTAVKPSGGVNPLLFTSKSHTKKAMPAKERVAIEQELLATSSFAPTKAVPKHSIRDDIRRAQIAPAVPLPHAGASYRPTPDAHHELIQIVGGKEVKRLVNADRDAKALTYPPELDLLPDETLDDDSTDEEQEAEDQAGLNDAAAVAAILRKRAESDGVRVPMAKRNRRALQVRRELQDVQKKRRLATDRQIKQLIATDAGRERMAQNLTELAKLKAAMRREMDRKRQTPLTARPATYQRPIRDVREAVALPDELSESMRAMIPDGDLIADRFTSFQQRGLTEVSRKVRTGRRANTKGWYKIKERRAHARWEVEENV
ncbi:hypothetical protein CXG81DRAFT_19851 [Caulochytrium protostelioides]|uniref:Ribosome biogenesis protein NOP53 n=1 Tax=Caulochytrium protostelioides TaxID=1555241 RepID=A0A4P9X4Y3_9FUNG|nr:hypothetical protein CXG81DRAFT_19851 [Caulochytrium protostelioides]|eukprot:RKP00156.1 hypothetical protein CXG81DRAFT_19851 [Caulochytrium protostelioides]